jgi:hypothetical protein
VWKELITRLGIGCNFLAPASVEVIAAAESKLSVNFPSDLRDLLLEANGISRPNGVGLIWTVQRIVEDNAMFRSNPDFRTLYMPFDDLLFFGDDGSGDQFAFRILAGQVSDLNMLRWCHENDGREWSARNMRDYLARSLGHDSFLSTIY